MLLLAAAPAGQGESGLPGIPEQNNEAAFALYRQIAMGTTDNLFFSPFSISTALSMTYAGADGSTADEMQKALHYGPNTPEYHTAYGDFLRKLEQDAANRIELNIANRLWCDADYELHAPFMKLNAEAYNAPVEQLDFQGKHEASRRHINRWVEGQTKKRISNLIPEGAVNEDTRLVLTNAIYFKGQWATQFNKALTRERSFHPLAASSFSHSFMHIKQHFGYNEQAAYSTLRLPYEGGMHSMVLVLPHSNAQFAEAEAAINPEALRNALRARSHEVQVALPKFKLDIPLSLKNQLKAMGMEEAFSTAANFSRMSPTADLAISEVIHKAFVEIDEEGTEAAAATAVVMMTTSSAMQEPRMPKTFIADRPFLFYIVDDSTGAVLFMGRMMQPATA